MLGGCRAWAPAMASRGRFSGFSFGLQIHFRTQDSRSFQDSNSGFSFGTHFRIRVSVSSQVALPYDGNKKAKSALSVKSKLCFS